MRLSTCKTYFSDSFTIESGMTKDGRQLQRIDALLRQEPVDRLREILSKSEAELDAKRSAVVALIGEAHPEVLRCATAISKIHNYSEGLVEISRGLKPLQSELQSILLAVGPIHPNHDALWEMEEQKGNENGGQAIAAAEWLKINPCLWEVLMNKDKESQQHGIEEEEGSLPLLEKLTRKKRRVQRLLLRCYGELPRFILEMLNRSKPLQCLCLLCGWGPRLRCQLISSLNDGVKGGENKEHVLSVLKRQKSYFLCHDLLSRVQKSAHQALVNVFPSPWIEASSSSLSTQWGSLLPPRCQCSACQPLLQMFSYPGTSGMVEILAAILLVNPMKDYNTLGNEVFESRTGFLERLVSVDLSRIGLHDETSFSSSNFRNCDLVKACFNQPTATDSLNFNFDQIVKIGFHLSNAIRVFEVTNDLLSVLNDEHQLFCLQQTIIQLFKLFSNNSETDNIRNNSESIKDRCDCYFCTQQTNDQPIVHLWNDCSHSPIVSETFSSSKSLVSRSTAHSKSLLLNFIEQALQIVSVKPGVCSLTNIDGMWRLVSPGCFY